LQTSVEIYSYKGLLVEIHRLHAPFFGWKITLFPYMLWND